MIAYEKLDKEDYLGNRLRDFYDYLSIHNDNGRSYLIMCPDDFVLCNCCDQEIKDEYVFINRKHNYIFCDNCRNDKLKEILND